MAGAPRHESGTRRWPLALRLLLMLGTLVLLLVPLELALRWRGDHGRRNARLWSVDTSQPPADMRPERLRMVDIVRAAAWRDLVYDLRPALAGRFQGAGYVSNADGMRDGEVSQAKPPGTYRIALLGDSIGFGWGVELEESFANLLEQQLTDDAGGRRVEVLNFCVPGYNTAMQAACLEHKALAFQPDLLLLQYFFNDAFMPGFLLREPERPVLYLWDTLIERLDAARGAPVLEHLAADPDFAETAFAEWRRDPARVPPEFASMVGEEGVERALRRIAAAAQAAQIPVAMLVVTLPTQRMIERGDEPLPWATTDQPAPGIAQTLGFLLIPTLRETVAYLRERQQSIGDFVLSETDYHPNPEGHRFYAELISGALEEADLLTREK